MPDEPKVEVKDSEYGGISVDHPSIVAACHNLAKQGMSKEQAAKIVGMPVEVIERHYRSAKS